MCLSLFLGYADLSFLIDLEPNTTCPLHERALGGSVSQRVPISQDGNTHRCPPRQGDYSPTATDAPWLKMWFLTTAGRPVFNVPVGLTCELVRLFAVGLSQPAQGLAVVRKKEWIRGLPIA